MSLSHSLNTLLDSPFRSLIFALGVYGWWRLVSRDSITAQARRWFYMRYPYEGFSDMRNRPRRGESVWSSGTWYTTKGTFWGELLYCPYCLGWWVAIAQFAVYVASPRLVLGLGLMHACRIFAGFLSRHN